MEIFDYKLDGNTLLDHKFKHPSLLSFLWWLLKEVRIRFPTAWPGGNEECPNRSWCGFGWSLSGNGIHLVPLSAQTRLLAFAASSSLPLLHPLQARTSSASRPNGTIAIDYMSFGISYGWWEYSYASMWYNHAFLGSLWQIKKFGA